MLTRTAPLAHLEVSCRVTPTSSNSAENWASTPYKTWTNSWYSSWDVSNYWTGFSNCYSQQVINIADLSKTFQVFAINSSILNWLVNIISLQCWMKIPPCFLASGPLVLSGALSIINATEELAANFSLHVVPYHWQMPHEELATNFSLKPCGALSVIKELADSPIFPCQKL